MSACKGSSGKRQLGPQVGGEGKGAPGERCFGSPGKKGRQGALLRSWVRTPKRSEVADRRLEADLGIEVTGIKMEISHAQKN